MIYGILLSAFVAVHFFFPYLIKQRYSIKLKFYKLIPIHFPSPQLLFIFVLCTVLFSACENNEQEVKDLNRKELGIEIAKEVNINFTTSGATKAILTSPLMNRVQDSVPYVEFPNTLHVDFYNDQQQKESKLDARYGRYKESEKKVFLRDSVVIINMIKRDTIYCDELYWDRSRVGNEFYTDKKVRIRTANGTQLNGTGMNASQDFKNIVITYPTGPLDVPAGNFPR